MKFNTEHFIITSIFRSLAILCGLMALWNFARSFASSHPDILSAGFDASRYYIVKGVSWLGSGLVLWWMGLVVGLLGRIAHNTAAAEVEISAPAAAPAPVHRAMKSIISSQPSRLSKDDDPGIPPTFHL